MSKSARKNAYDRLSGQEKIAINVRIWMRKKGITATALAEHLEVPRSTVTRRLRGEGRFGEGELFLIAHFLQCDISEFSSEEDDFDDDD